jgi:hypothetical protein
MEIFSRYIVRYHGKDLHLLTLLYLTPELSDDETRIYILSI